MTDKIEKIEEYALGPEIGSGAFAIVRLGTHEPTGEKVAVKIIDRNLVRRDNLEERVKKEISIMGKLRHPNIVQLKKVLLTSSSIFLVEEYAPGTELFKLVRDTRGLQEHVIRHFFKQILDAVEYCHQVGVCHRDLKLENIRVDIPPGQDCGHLKLLDFGFSRNLDSCLKSSVGTPTYLAPEALQGQNYNGTGVDIWACGVMLYVMAEGKYPFGNPNRNFQSLFNRIRNAEYDSPAHPHSLTLLDLLSRILVADPAARISLSSIRQHAWMNGASSQSASCSNAASSPSPVAGALRNPSVDSVNAATPPSRHTVLSQHAMDVSSPQDTSASSSSSLEVRPSNSACAMDTAPSLADPLTDELQWQEVAEPLWMVHSERSVMMVEDDHDDLDSLPSIDSNHPFSFS